MPVWSVAPSSTSSATSSPIRSSTSLGGAWRCAGSGRLVRMNACTRSTATIALPWVRGIRSLISAITIRA
jgi:hypothetical protein